jgi:putative hemolysin
MSPAILFGLAISGLFLAAFAAIGTRVLQRFHRHELEDFCRMRGRVDVFERVIDSHDRLILAAESLQLIGTVLLILSGSLYLFGDSNGSALVEQWHFLLAVVTSAACVLLLTSWVPWSVARLWAVPFLFHTWRVWWAASWLGWPLSLGAMLCSYLLSRFSSRDPDEIDEEEALEDEIMSIVASGEREGLLEKTAREMIEGVIELDDLSVGEIMTPRSKVDALEVNQSWSQIIHDMSRANRSRYPVYEGTPDQIVGTLVVRDLLKFFIQGKLPNQPLRHLARPALVVPKTRLSDDMLSEFLKLRQHLAVVVDEYHSMVGIVTIEDILEEIVGEIVDESEMNLEQSIQQSEPGIAVALGHVRIDELNDELGLALQESDEYDTIAGMLIAEFREIPPIGTVMETEAARITVLESTPRQVVRVEIAAKHQLSEPTAAP